MLEWLILSRFQCHERETFDLANSITTLVGPSGSGKTAALRALRWVMFNQPRGDHFVTHEETSCAAKLIFDNGRSLIRKYSKSAGHAYRLDGQEFKAFGTEVPEAIRTALNVGPATFQRQFDAHWFLSKTAGEVSRELNDIVDLGVIDNTMSAVSSELKKATAEVELTKKRLEEAETARNKLAWVPTYVSRITELEVKRELFNNERRKASALRSLIKEAYRAEEAYKTNLRAEEGLSQAVTVGKKALAARDKASGLRNLLNLYRLEQVKAVRKIPDLTRLEALKANERTAREKAYLLKGLISEYRRAMNEAKEATQRLKEVKQRLKDEAGEECPVCGGPMRDGLCSTLVN